jgi:hypothetical protein
MKNLYHSFKYPWAWSISSLLFCESRLHLLLGGAKAKVTGQRAGTSAGPHLLRLDGGAPSLLKNSSQLSYLQPPNLSHRYHCDTLGLLHILLRLPALLLNYHPTPCCDITTIRLAQLTTCRDLVAELSFLQRNADIYRL